MSKTKCGGSVTNVAAKQQTQKHWFTTTISDFVVLSEELAKHSPEITRLPMMGPTRWHRFNYLQTRKTSKSPSLANDNTTYPRNWKYRSNTITILMSKIWKFPMFVLILQSNSSILNFDEKTFEIIEIIDFSGFRNVCFNFTDKLEIQPVRVPCKRRKI